jgi:shikimate kinase
MRDGRNMRNLVLIGMPGAGKSTIGVLLAKALRMQFLDTDIAIQEREKATLKHIIDSSGIEAFLACEEDVVCSLTVQNHVLATGGSVVYSPRAMGHLKKGGFLIFLKLDFSEIERRVQNIRGRGVVLRPGQTLYDLFEEREPLYGYYADHILDCNGMDMETTVETIKEKIWNIG